MTHHFVMTSSLLIQILKIDKFCDFSCDIGYNSRTTKFRDVISLIINQCDPRRPKDASGEHKVFSRAAQASKARLFNKVTIEITGIRVSDSICSRFYLLHMRLKSNTVEPAITATLYNGHLSIAVTTVYSGHQ